MSGKPTGPSIVADPSGSSPGPSLEEVAIDLTASPTTPGPVLAVKATDKTPVNPQFTLTTDAKSNPLKAAVITNPDSLKTAIGISDSPTDEEVNKIKAAFKQQADSTTPHTFPLNTQMDELINFEQYLINNPPYSQTKHPFGLIYQKKIFGDFFGNTGEIIKEMDFNTYWALRDFQMLELQFQLQKRLKLLEENGEFEADDSWFDKLRIKMGWADTPEDRITYIKKMLALMDGVRIEPDPDNSKNNTNNMLITKNGTPLVSITENLVGGSNCMTFKITKEVINGDPQQLKNAIEILVDQATRLLERSNDHERKFRISGYLNHPEIVLQMYLSAIAHDLQPTIESDIEQHWIAKSSDPSLSKEEQTKFTEALDRYHDLVDVLQEKNEEKKSGMLQKIKKLIAKKFAEKHSAISPSNTEEQLPTIPSTPNTPRSNSGQSR